jgi:hypothetical protein
LSKEKATPVLKCGHNSFYLVRQARQLMIRRHGQLEQNQRLSMLREKRRQRKRKKEKKRKEKGRSDKRFRKGEQIRQA